SNNRQYLKESAEALMRIVFEWDVMSPTNKRPWKASVMFPEVEIHADVIRYQISSQLRELIVKPEIYAVIDMNVVRRFRRASSLAIWEFCV
ncbi:RepB family plasmid replication initiator protein, partial [Acinetobacter baumannii]